MACGGPAAPATALDRPDILLIDVDSLRADFLSPEACTLGYTPHLCALAARGTWFTEAWSHSGWTLPALDALLTGRFPSETSFGVQEPALMNVRVYDGALQERPGTPPPPLPEILSLYGYDTRAFWGFSTAGVAPFLRRGFVENHRVEPGVPAAEVWHEPVARWLDGPPVEPFFALYHPLDVHMSLGHLQDLPSSPFLPSPLLRRVTERGMDRVFADLGGRSRRARLAGARLCYGERLRWYDAQVGLLLEGLERAGVADRTLVVVTSNHGEGLSPRLPGTHGPPYGETLHVPLVWADPAAPGGVVVDAQVQHVDLAPTLLERVGAVPPADLDGRSFLALTGGAPEGPGWGPRPLYAVTSLRVQGLRDGAWSLVRILYDGTAEAEDLELYRLDEDPEEVHDVAGEYPAVAQAMGDRLVRWLAALQARGEPPEPLDPTQRRQLQDRGYWGDFDVSGAGSASR